MSTPGDRSSDVRSVLRALDLLEGLAHEEGLGLTELASRAGISHSTAHRLLATLIARGFVRQDLDTRHYRLGYGAARLAAALERLDAPLRAAARPSMQRVRTLARETTNLLILDGDHVVYVDQVPGALAMRMVTEPGTRVPAHATAAGKAMLALLSPAEVDVRLAAPLVALTDHTITEPRALRAELRRTRKRGYALDRQECEVAVSCIAAAIVWDDGTVAGALSVSGPTSRLVGLADHEALGELVARNALEVSRALGYDRPSPFDVAPVLDTNSAR